MNSAKRLFIYGAPFVILIDFISGILAEYFQVQIEQVMNNPQGQSHWIWLYGSLNVIIYLLLASTALCLTLFFLSGVSKDKLGTFIGQNFSALVKEALRSLGKAGLWSFLLILPGIIRFIQFSMVPFVVAFDPAYARGERDALKASTQLVNRSLPAVLAIEVFIYFGLSFLIAGLFSQWTSFAKTPILASLLTALQSFVFLLSFWLLYRIYQRSQEKGDVHA